MAKRKSTKGQTMIYKTLHRKQKIELQRIAVGSSNLLFRSIARYKRKGNTLPALIIITVVVELFGIQLLRKIRPRYTMQHEMFYDTKVQTLVINNSTNINKTHNHPSPKIIEN